MNNLATVKSEKEGPKAIGVVNRPVTMVDTPLMNKKLKEAIQELAEVHPCLVQNDMKRVVYRDIITLISRPGSNLFFAGSKVTVAMQHTEDGNLLAEIRRVGVPYERGIIAEIKSLQNGDIERLLEARKLETV